MSSISLLRTVRENLTIAGVHAFIVGSGDAHQSEYVHESDMRRAFISNFNGSAGTALILADKNQAYLWTDGRYFLQAEKQLTSDWILMKSGEPGVLEINEWIVANMPTGSVVAVDPFLVSTSHAKTMEKMFQPHGIVLKPIQSNPIDAVWGLNRPKTPLGQVKTHPTSLAGMSHSNKIAMIQKELLKKKYVGFVVSMLDEIAWLFNIRGSDVSFNPVVISYAVVTTTEAHLFIDECKLSSTVKLHLADVKLHPYENITGFLTQLASNGIVMADPSQLNWSLYSCLGTSAVDGVSPITLAKSVKNASEIQGIRDCHVRDGAALTAFLHYLETTVKAKPGSVTEYDVIVKLEEFRRRISQHVSPSFDTIAGYGPNGAIIHYKPAELTAARLSTDSLFLLDSGAQYSDGTTDVTRTVHFGVASDHMKYCYTLVLKGHIALARVVFPEGTLGSRLDCLARVPLWTAGLDYNHGTGHGVGAYLNVHEGPQGIGYRKRENEAGFLPGMTISNEPGYYEEGAFGIRIENVCVTVEADVVHHFGGRRYCKLETVTMTPIKKDLIMLSLLDDGELTWLNEYHLQVREKVMPLLSTEFPESVEYLTRETEPLLRQ